MAVLFNDTIRCYDDGRVERLSERGNKWKEVKNTKGDDGYNRIITADKKLIRRHRIIPACFLGLNIDDPTQTIDHINRNRLDNSVDNLRIVSNQQNCFNRGEPKGYYRYKNKWKGVIVLDKKSIHLGLFNTEEEAHQAYLEGKCRLQDELQSCVFFGL